MKKGNATTRKEQKHEMMLTFMANARSYQKQNGRTRGKPGLLRSILSLFM